MKKLLFVFLFALVACSSDQTQPTEQLINNSLTLKYFAIAPKGTAAQCKKITLDDGAIFIGCNYVGVGTRTHVGVWFYDENKDPLKRFYAMNGTAKTALNQIEKTVNLGDYSDTFGELGGNFKNALDSLNQLLRN